MIPKSAGGVQFALFGHGEAEALFICLLLIPGLPSTDPRGTAVLPASCSAHPECRHGGLASDLPIAPSPSSFRDRGTTTTQEAEKIRKLKTYAQHVLAAAESEPPVKEPSFERLFQDIRAAAQETVRRAGEPVKIGILGEFNAGKSLLLGSLIGHGDALPVSEVPTTGNITALWIRPQAELQKTEVGPYRVEFLDRPTALEWKRRSLQFAEQAGARAEPSPATAWS